MTYEIIVGRSAKTRKLLGDNASVLLGKQYISMGQVTALANKVYLDVNESHAIFVVGKRGSGKCLHEDTLILLDDGSQVTIKELEEKHQNIFTLNQELKIVPGQKTEFFKRRVNKLLEITFRSFKSIKLTPEHPLLTVAGWMPAEKLNLGSRIATPRKIEVFGDKAHKECEVKLLAYLLTEGHLSNGFVLFSKMDTIIFNDFTQAINHFDNNLRIDIHSKEGTFRVSQKVKKIKSLGPRNIKGQFTTGPKFDHSSIRNWLESLKLYGKLSKEKFIPALVFQLPRHQLSLFLNRLFSCDGTIFIKSGHWFVSYASSSKEMISQVQHLLLRFGIISKIRSRIIRKKFPSYELHIYGENVESYLQNIGFFGKKEERQAVALKESIKIIRNPNTDTIPKEIWDIYKPSNWAELGRKVGYAYPKALRESMKYAPSRQKLLQIALADNSLLMEQFATSDIFWDEVVSLRYIEGEFTVYDISVPETHNFIANDIIVHNSYSLGVMAEGINQLPQEIRQKLSCILLDTMGVYWTMKYPNHKDETLLNEWGLQSEAMDVKIYTPFGFVESYREQGIPSDMPFAIHPMELTASDWALSFEISLNDSMGVILEKVIGDFKDSNKTYTIEDIIKEIEKVDVDKNIKNALINRFTNASHWGVFSTEATPIESLAKGGQVTVLDLSPYATIENGWAIKSLVIGILASKLFIARMKSRKEEELRKIEEATKYFTDESDEMKDPLVWLIIDEAHEFLPNDKITTATDSLVTILREGRQPGISLVLASQQPGKIHTDVMTQSDIIIAHRLTAKIDVDALGMVAQSYLREGIVKELNALPSEAGAALILDDANERIFPVRMKPRSSWHGGETPHVLKEKERK